MFNHVYLKGVYEVYAWDAAKYIALNLAVVTLKPVLYTLMESSKILTDFEQVEWKTTAWAKVFRINPEFRILPHNAELGRL